jgi:hypothetical protein
LYWTCGSYKIHLNMSQLVQILKKEEKVRSITKGPRPKDPRLISTALGNLQVTPLFFLIWYSWAAHVSLFPQFFVVLAAPHPIMFSVTERSIFFMHSCSFWSLANWTKAHNDNVVPTNLLILQKLIKGSFSWVIVFFTESQILCDVEPTWIQTPH